MRMGVRYKLPVLHNLQLPSFAFLDLPRLVDREVGHAYCLVIDRRNS